MDQVYICGVMKDCCVDATAGVRSIMVTGSDWKYLQHFDQAAVPEGFGKVEYWIQ